MRSLSIAVLVLRLRETLLCEASVADFPLGLLSNIIRQQLLVAKQCFRTLIQKGKRANIRIFARCLYHGGQNSL